MRIRSMSSRLVFTSLGLLVLAACSGNGDGAPTSEPESEELRAVTAETGGGIGDALAAALLESTGRTVPRAGQPAFVMGDGALAQEMAFRADSHLEAAALAVGAGASLTGSARIRRLAEAPSAPSDANGDGTNLDETLAADLAMLAARAGATPPPAVHPILAPWATGTADLAASPGDAGRGAWSAYRGIDVPATAWQWDMEQLGASLRARVLAAGRLLLQSRGSFAGATSDEGARGLLLLQQAVALEESLVSDLFWDGNVAVGMPDANTYDPLQAPVWLPRRMGVFEELNRPGVIGNYMPADPASTVSGVAAVLHGASELAWWASDQNPEPTMRDILLGNPFGNTSLPRRPRGQRPRTAPGTALTWEDDVRGIIQGQCMGCHRVPPPFNVNNFYVTSYASVIAGGDHAATNPTVVPGDHAASLIWQVLNAPVPSIGVNRMPDGGPYLGAGEVSIIADWIDQGALESSGEPPVPLAIGKDLARVMIANLEALHLDAATGALHDRYEGDGVSGLAAAGSTGSAMQALANFLTAVPGDPQATALLGKVADYALGTLSDEQGNARALVDIRTGADVEGAADLRAHARLTAGMFAAGRALARSDLPERGRALATALLDRFFDPGTGLFRTDLELRGRLYTPAVIAAVLDALREAAADGTVGEAGAVHDRFLRALRPVLVFSEWDGNGEVLGDGIPDTDGNGVPEPALAGGTNGLAPVFAGEILEGPAPGSEPVDGPITWSEHLLPLFRSKCATCHLDGLRQGNYRLDTPAKAAQFGDSGGAFPLIVPGDPEASLLYRKLVDRRPPIGDQMPLMFPPVDAKAKQMVHRWIREGALDR